MSILQQEKAKEDTLLNLGKNEKHIIHLFLLNKLLWTLIKQYIDISKRFKKKEILVIRVLKIIKEIKKNTVLIKIY